MKTTLIQIIAVVITYSTCYSQQAGVQENIHVGAGLVGTKKTESHKVEGSQYAEETYFTGTLSNSGKTIVARYNGYSDAIEIKEGDNITILTPNKEINITSNDTKKNYVYIDYITKSDESITGYLNLLSKNSKVSVYKRERIILEPEFHPTNSYEQYKAAKYKKMDAEFYLQVGEDAVLPFPKKKKELEKLVPGKEKELNAFLKEHKISFSKDEDLVKLGGFLEKVL